MHRKVIVIPGRSVKNYELLAPDGKRQRVIVTEQVSPATPESRRRLPEKLPSGQPNFIPRTPNPFVDVDGNN